MKPDRAFSLLGAVFLALGLSFIAIGAGVGGSALFHGEVEARIFLGVFCGIGGLFAVLGSIFLRHPQAQGPAQPGPAGARGGAACHHHGGGAQRRGAGKRALPLSGGVPVRGERHGVPMPERKPLVRPQPAAHRGRGYGVPGSGEPQTLLGRPFRRIAGGAGALNPAFPWF